MLVRELGVCLVWEVSMWERRRFVGLLGPLLDVLLDLLPD